MGSLNTSVLISTDNSRLVIQNEHCQEHSIADRSKDISEAPNIIYCLPCAEHGMTYKARASWSQSPHSSQRQGKPATGRRGIAGEST